MTPEQLAKLEEWMKQEFKDHESDPKKGFQYDVGYCNALTCTMDKINEIKKEEISNV